ncbi:MAG: response regulator, partial [Candidatus Polarisedimenticolia bacterium]
MQKDPTREPLRLLHVEDDADDAILIGRALEEAGYAVAPVRVDTPEGMAAALDKGDFDLVISDHRMPRFDAPAALRILRERG